MWRAVEVGVVYFALVPLVTSMAAFGVLEWQERTMPAFPFVSEIGVFVGLPLAITAIARRDLMREGFAITLPPASRRLVPRVVFFAWLSTLAFLLLAWMGETYRTLWGALVLAGSTALCGVLMLAGAGDPSAPTQPTGLSARVVLWRLFVLLGLGVLGVLATDGRLASLFGKVLLTAACEELFFRGYVQGGLDAAFGRRWRWFGICVGPGLPISAVLFGCWHLVPFVAVGSAVPWPWALWTTVLGLFTGALRNRTEGITVPWIMHGTLLAISALGSR